MNLNSIDISVTGVHKKRYYDRIGVEITFLIDGGKFSRWAINGTLLWWKWNNEEYLTEKESYAMDERVKFVLIELMKTNPELLTNGEQ